MATNLRLGDGLLAVALATALAATLLVGSLHQMRGNFLRVVFACHGVFSLVRIFLRQNKTANSQAVLWLESTLIPKEGSTYLALMNLVPMFSFCQANSSKKINLHFACAKSSHSQFREFLGFF